MYWQAESWWVWWSQQPEIIARDAEARRQEWQRTNLLNCIARQSERLHRDNSASLGERLRVLWRFTSAGAGLRLVASLHQVHASSVRATDGC
jgi:hypothetical protein